MYRHRTAPEAELSGKTGRPLRQVGLCLCAPRLFDPLADRILYFGGFVTELHRIPNFDNPFADAGADRAAGARIEPQRMAAGRVGRFDDLFRVACQHPHTGLFDPRALLIEKVQRGTFIVSAGNRQPHFAVGPDADREPPGPR